MRRMDTTLAESHRPLDQVPSAGPVALSARARALLRPLSAAGTATIDGGYWADRQRVNREVSLRHGLDQLEAGGNLENLRVAAGRSSGPYVPTLTLDADVHKWIEAAAWELGREPSVQIQGWLDEVVDLVLAAQRADGYLNSWFQVCEPDRILTDLTRGCEMYCAGHLMQAGVAVARTTGGQRLLAAAVRFADLLEA